LSEYYYGDGTIAYEHRMSLKTKITTLTNHTGFRKYFANTSWILGERIFRMGVSLFVGIYIARYLGPERYGLLSYALSFVFLFSSLAYFGLNDILVRELVLHPEQRKELLGTVFWLSFGGTVIMCSAIAMVLQLFENESQTEWMIALIAFGYLFQTTIVIDYYFQSQVQSKFVAYAQVLQLCVTSAFKIYLVWNKAELFWFAFALMLDQVVIAVLFLTTYRWKVEWLPVFSFSWQKAKNLLKNAWPLIFTGMAVSIYMKIDQVMLKEMLDAEAVGIYAAAVKLCEAWYFIPTAVTASLFPAIVSAKQRSEVLYQKRLQKFYDLMVWGAVAVALPTTFLADWIILILYGADYQEAVDVLRIYIWAGVFIFLGVAGFKWLVAENLQKYSFYFYAIGSIFNIGLNWLLIPIYGIDGAAYATFISYGIGSYGVFSIFNISRSNFIMASLSFNPYGVYKRSIDRDL
jgi:O-antigen/teichoic acid export membrane protein